MQQGHSCLAQYSIRDKIFSNLQFIHTSIAALTAKPEVVDNVINPLFQRFTSSDASSLLQKKQNKNKGDFSTKKQNKVASLLRKRTSRSNISFVWETSSYVQHVSDIDKNYTTAFSSLNNLQNLS